MNTAVGRALIGQSWRDLYQAAICESDLNKLPGRIDDAEAALVKRGRELFHAVGGEAEERESLDETMCMLHALRNSLKHRPTPVKGASVLDYRTRA